MFLSSITSFVFSFSWWFQIELLNVAEGDFYANETPGLI